MLRTQNHIKRSTLQLQEAWSVKRYTKSFKFMKIKYLKEKLKTPFLLQNNARYVFIKEHIKLI